MKKIAMMTTLALLASTSAWGLPLALKCEANKNKSAGKYASCLQQAEAFFVKTGDGPKYGEKIGKCDTKLTEKWTSIETKAAGSCVDTVLDTDLTSFVTAHSEAVAVALHGGPLPNFFCGNGTVDVGESCDFGDLGGEDCNTVTAGVLPRGTLTCGAGCAFDTTDCNDCPVGTVPLSGNCWVMGSYASAEGAGSCDAACNSLGLACDQIATRSIGSGGTTADCKNVADALDPVFGHAPYSTAGPFDSTSCGDDASFAIGCSILDDSFGPPDPPNYSAAIYTTSQSTSCSADGLGGFCASVARRLCACN